MTHDRIRSALFPPPRRTNASRASRAANTGSKRVLRAPLQLKAVVLAGALMVFGTAAACEQYSAYPDVVLDSFYASAPTQPRMFMDQERGRSAMRKCSFPGGPIPIFVRLDVPGLTYVGSCSMKAGRMRPTPPLPIRPCWPSTCTGMLSTARRCVWVRRWKSCTKRAPAMACNTPSTTQRLCSRAADGCSPPASAPESFRCARRCTQAWTAVPTTILHQPSVREDGADVTFRGTVTAVTPETGLHESWGTSAVAVAGAE